MAWKTPGFDEISTNPPMNGEKEKIFVILKSSGNDLKDAEVLKVLESKTKSEAEKEAVKWLLGDGLPCDGSVNDVYSVAEILVGAQVAAKLLWVAQGFVEKEH